MLYIWYKLRSNKPITKKRNRQSFLYANNIEVTEVTTNNFIIYTMHTKSTMTDINGYNEQSMRDILYCVTGYRDFDQL